jgi:hypothetical protein
LSGSAVMTSGATVKDRVGERARLQLQTFQTRLAAHPARRGGGEVALEPRGVRQLAAAQGHVDGVVALLRLGAVRDAQEVVAAFENTFAIQKSGGEFKVRAGGAHGHGDGLPLVSGNETDF